MKPEYLEKLIEWYREELEDFKAQGVDGETLKKPAFAEVVLESMVGRHLSEIRADPIYSKRFFEKHRRKHSFREMELNLRGDDRVRWLQSAPNQTPKPQTTSYRLGFQALLFRPPSFGDAFVLYQILTVSDPSFCPNRNQLIRS